MKRCKLAYKSCRKIKAERSKATERLFSSGRSNGSPQQSPGFAAIFSHSSGQPDGSPQQSPGFAAIFSHSSGQPDGSPQQSPGFAAIFSPRLSKSNGLVNHVFTRPFSFVVQN